MTDKPFGVNITVLPMLNAPNYADYVQALIDGGVNILETAGTPQVRELVGAGQTARNQDPA